MGFKKLTKLGSGIFLALTLCVALTSLPASAAQTGGPPEVTSGTTSAAAPVLPYIQGEILSVSLGATCIVSGVSCIVNSTSTGALPVGAVLEAAHGSNVSGHAKYAHIPYMTLVVWGEGIGGLAESIIMIITFW